MAIIRGEKSVFSSEIFQRGEKKLPPEPEDTSSSPENDEKTNINETKNEAKKFLFY